MDIQEMLERMRDPLGAPFFPEVFRVLLVVTWVFHIFFVTLAAGSSVLAIWGFLKKGENELKIARVAAQLTSNTVGLGIVTGIAPMLFVQVIYDPVWYASNALTGFWSVMFVFVVMFGYSLSYLFYRRRSEDRQLMWAAVSSSVLLFFAGFIMHVLASVSIRPEKWMGWYAPKGIIDTRGVQFHSVNLPRLVFLLPLQAGLSIGVLLMLFAWYGAKRDEPDHEHLAWVAALGRRIALVVSPLYAVAGIAWGLTEGRDFGIAPSLTVILAVVGLGLTAWFARVKDPAASGRSSLLVWLVVLAVVAAVREYVRAVSLNRYGYSVSDYPYNIDWGSVILFAATAVPGVAAITYLIRVMYQSGLKSSGGEISVGVDRLGTVSMRLLGAWFGFFLGLGLLAVFALN